MRNLLVVRHQKP